MIIAVIPARGGSKRIPHKNIIDFCGKPMIGWTIEAAVKTKKFDKIYVSTDDKEISDVCRNYPIDVLRRNGYSDDHTTVQQATIKTLKQIEQEKGQTFDTVVQLMATCPLRTAEDILNALYNYNITKSQFQLSACEYDFLNPWWALRLDENNKPRPLYPEALKTRSQDLPKLYCPVGAVWIADVKELFKQQTFYGKDYDIFPIDFKHAIDIDTYDDLETAKKFVEG